MTFFPDLGTLTMVAGGPHVRAIGWLDPAFPFPTGMPPRGFPERLSEFVAASKASGISPMFGVFPGGHHCELCDDGAAHGAANIGVPSGDIIFIAPALVAHYVADHQYLPPDEFVAALIHSPLPGTFAYRGRLAPFVGRLTLSADDAQRVSVATGEWIHRLHARKARLS
jgi:hypothetical protein